MKHHLTKIWYVVETFSGAEWTAHTGLLRRGQESYFPYTLADRRHGRWLQASIRPQFPGYIFASVENGDSVEPILRTIGVRNLLRSGVNIIAIPQSKVDQIRQQCSARYRESVPSRKKLKVWRVGDVVPVPYGPFVGVPVEIRSIDKSGRAVASIGALTVSFHLEGMVQNAVPSLAAIAQSLPSC